MDDLDGLGSGHLIALAPGVALLIGLVVILATGRVAIARTFSGARYADRRDSPALYWFFVLAHCWFTAAVCWWTAAQFLGLADRLAPGVRTTVERATPWAVLASLAIYAVAALALGSRRRLRTTPSSLPPA